MAFAPTTVAEIYPVTPVEKNLNLPDQCQNHNLRSRHILCSVLGRGVRSAGALPSKLKLQGIRASPLEGQGSSIKGCREGEIVMTVIIASILGILGIAALIGLIIVARQEIICFRRKDWLSALFGVGLMLSCLLVSLACFVGVRFVI